MNLDDKALDELESLERAASPGKWLNSYPNNCKLSPMPDHIWTSEKELIAKDLYDRDAAFIAAIRNATSALIAAARESQGLKERLHSKTQHANGLQYSYDALREENRLFRAAAADDFEIVKERDALRAENDGLRAALTRLSTRSFDDKDEANYQIKRWANIKEVIQIARAALEGKP
jgi:hypothetical protein